MPNFTTVPDVAVGQNFPPSLWESAIMNNLNLGVTRQLADTTLGVAAASVDFTSIPATFAHLLLVYTARVDGAITIAAPQIRFNGDSGTNYDYQRLENTSATAVGTSEGLAQPGGVINYVTGASGTAGKPGSAAIFIPQYAGAVFEKDWIGIGYARDSTVTAHGQISLHGGTWRSAAAINRITLLAPSGNFIIGARFTLYGFPA